MTNIERFAALALALSACAVQAAPAVRGDAIQLGVSGPDGHTVRLVDAVTHLTIASDRIAGEPVRGSVVSADNAMVAVRHGAPPAGDGIAL